MSPAIETHRLGKRFGDVAAVADLDLRVPAGSVFGFIGPNGAGKTTTIKMLVGLLAPSEGSVSVLGFDPDRRGVDVRQRIGYVAETQSLYGYLTGQELIDFTRRLYPRWDGATVARYLRDFGLPTSQRIRGYSKGMKTQLALVLALGNTPDLLVLDEPTSGLDPVMRREFLTTIISEVSARGCTVFFSSHILSDVERVVDQVAIIHRGRLVHSGSMDEARSNFRRLTVRFEDEVAPDALRLPGVRRVEPVGRGYRLVVVDDLPGVERAVARLGGKVLDSHGIGLEDLFVELTGVEPAPARAGEGERR